MRLALCLLALASLVACSASSTPSNVFDTGEGGEGGTAAGGKTGAGGTAAGGAGTGGQGDGGGTPLQNPDETDCGDVGKVIYVVSEENKLLSFDPQTLAFKSIGTLACSGFSTPFSMAVDRKGVAFVLYSDGNIYKVSTTDASCAPSGYKALQKGWSLFGMGWVSDTAGTNQETLFVIDGTKDSGNAGLGKITTQGQLALVGNFDGGLSGRRAEVTGRGDGKLFGFFVDAGTSKSSVAEIDRTSGHIISNVAQDLPPITAWAFAHWGGSFYLFNGNGGTSHVHKYTPDKGTTEVVTDAGVTIVGAGVSTCAPTVSPIN
jgi:hypothetical protein